MQIPSIKKCLVILILLVLVDCALAGYIGVWREWYWQAVENRLLKEVLTLIGYFTGVALVSCLVSGYCDYLVSYGALLIRRTMTNKALKLKHLNVEGISQRIQEDCLEYPKLYLSIVVGVVRNIVNLVVFSWIMLLKIDLIYALIPIVYSVLGTSLAGYIALPLILLNYVNQNVEAKFRQFLNKINYAKVHRNNFNLFNATKKLSYFQGFYNQITVIIPYVILFPLYYASKITFGAFMQVASAMHEVIGSLSYFINIFPEINKFIACRKRLQEINVI